jgi:hypothetical protein
MFQYSMMLKDPAMTRVNVVGFTLNLGYLLCYYIYSENKVSKDLIFSYVRFEIFLAVTMKNVVFWDVTPCRSCKNRHFRRMYRLHHRLGNNQ